MIIKRTREPPKKCLQSRSLTITAIYFGQITYFKIYVTTIENQFAKKI